MSVSVGIVTWNSGAVIEAAIASVRAQRDVRCELLVVDNASDDDTWGRVAAMTTPDERVLLPSNTGFSAAHNLAIKRTRGAFYLALNPDVVLAPDHVAALVRALEAAPDAGVAGGRLLCVDDPASIDSTGIVMQPSQRHLDRGQHAPDGPQFDLAAEVFGISGAAALYRRAMLADIAIDGEVFDEDFFAYREDADLAWRAQWRGWSALYVPVARATHGRRVTPERRHLLPGTLNRYSVRNRFLLRIKNQTAGLALRFAGPAALRDAQVLGYVLLREHGSLAGLADVIRLLPRMWRKRRVVMSRRRRSSAELAFWFHHDSRPAHGKAASNLV